MTKQPREKSPREKQPRENRRVTWSPPDTVQPQDVHDEIVDTSAEDWADREPNPDEKLTREKPPHWR